MNIKAHYDAHLIAGMLVHATMAHVTTRDIYMKQESTTANHGRAKACGEHRVAVLHARADGRINY